MARFFFLLYSLSWLASASAQPSVSAEQAFEAHKRGELKLLDIRTPREWRETGVAPGASRVDFYEGPEALLRAALKATGGDPNAPIALLCRTGNRSSQAQKILRSHGFTRVYDVSEGMAGSKAGAGWVARRLPVEPCRC